MQTNAAEHRRLMGRAALGSPSTKASGWPCGCFSCLPPFCVLLTLCSFQENGHFIVPPCSSLDSAPHMESQSLSKQWGPILILCFLVSGELTPSCCCMWLPTHRVVSGAGFLRAQYRTAFLLVLVLLWPPVLVPER